MNKLISILLTFSFAVTGFTQSQFQYKNLTILPAKPRPGDKIHFIYRPKIAFPKNRSVLEVEIFYWNKTTDDKRGGASFPLVKTALGWEASYQTHKEQRALKFSFNNHSPSWNDTTALVIDENPNAGYLVPLYNSKGLIARGAWIDMAWILGGSDRTGDRRLEYARKEKELNGLFNEKTEEAYYIILLGRGQSDKSIYAEVKKDMIMGMRTEVPNEERYSFAIRTYRTHFEDGKKADSLTIVRNRMFPNGEWVIKESIVRFLYKYPVDVDSMILLYNNYKNILINQGKTTVEINEKLADAAFFIVVQLGRQEKWKAFYDWLDKYDGYPSHVIESNVVDDLVQNGRKDSMVLDCAARVHAAEIKFINDKDPRWLRSVEWETYNDHVRDSRKWAYINDSKNYVDLLLANGHQEEAQQVIQEVMLVEKGQDIRTNELYARAMASPSASPQKTLDELAGFFKNEKGTLAMKEPMRTLWTACNRPAAAFEPYFDSLNNYTELQLRAKLQKEIINEPAPSFALKNLDGQEITLTSLKGKPVVLDFWATWCFPCKASMPAMQKAMKNLASKKIDAAFLFIDTWEEHQASEEIRQKEVADFIRDKKYPFNVLFDEKVEGNYSPSHKKNYTVVSAYRVEGIPTKFVINSKGNIRFKVVGFGGNDDEVIRTVSLMLKMAEE